MQSIDQALGRLLLRTFAVLAFLAAAGSAAFGAVVLSHGHLPGVLLLLLGALFLWLGRRAWRDRATLGELLDRDFEPAAPRKPGTRVSEKARRGDPRAGPLR